MNYRIVCETTELAVECLQLAQALELQVAPVVPDDGWLAAACARDPSSGPIVVATQAAPELSALVELAETGVRRNQPVLIAITAPGDARRLVLGAGADLGLCMLEEVEPLLAALALTGAGANAPWQASTRALPSVDRLRLAGVADGGGRSAGQLVRHSPLVVAFRADGQGPLQPLGRPADVAQALAALRACHAAGGWVRTDVDVDRQAVLDVLFGPPRALSDPASKTALAPYGLPMPEEELCASASRAAGEAARLGFPVRIALASPDLRLWDHPDLSIDMLDSAAAVRDAYRQLTALAGARTLREGDTIREPRLLGVTVAAANRTHALLALQLRAVGHGRVAAHLGFADDHGHASNDRILTVLPTEPEQVARVLSRLQGSDLLLAGPPALRAERLESLTSLLLRTAAFALDFEQHVASVELRPVAILLDGTSEVREACVTVSDAFARRLAQAGTGG